MESYQLYLQRNLHKNNIFFGEQQLRRIKSKVEYQIMIGIFLQDQILLGKESQL
jgi:hypothetical protein